MNGNFNNVNGFHSLAIPISKRRKNKYSSSNNTITSNNLQYQSLKGGRINEW